MTRWHGTERRHIAREVGDLVDIGAPWGLFVAALREEVPHLNFAQILDLTIEEPDLDDPEAPTPGLLLDAWVHRFADTASLSGMVSGWPTKVLADELLRPDDRPEWADTLTGLTPDLVMSIVAPHRPLEPTFDVFSIPVYADALIRLMDPARCPADRPSFHEALLGRVVRASVWRDSDGWPLWPSLEPLLNQHARSFG